jgi:hypothetical protein
MHDDANDLSIEEPVPTIDAAGRELLPPEMAREKFQEQTGISIDSMLELVQPAPWPSDEQPQPGAPAPAVPGDGQEALGVAPPAASAPGDANDVTTANGTVPLGAAGNTGAVVGVDAGSRSPPGITPAGTGLPLPATDSAVSELADDVDPLRRQLCQLLRDYIGQQDGAPEMAELRRSLESLVGITREAAAGLGRFIERMSAPHLPASDSLAAGEGGDPGVEHLRSLLGWPASRWRDLRTAAEDLRRAPAGIDGELKRRRGRPPGAFRDLVRSVADVVRQEGERADETYARVALFVAGLAVDAARAPTWWLAERGKSLWSEDELSSPRGQASTLFWSPTFEVALEWVLEEKRFCVNIEQLAERIAQSIRRATARRRIRPGKPPTCSRKNVAKGPARKPPAKPAKRRRKVRPVTIPKRKPQRPAQKRKTPRRGKRSR